jgi:T5SS/PEP-CTERM-associated repeat protein
MFDANTRTKREKPNRIIAGDAFVPWPSAHSRASQLLFRHTVLGGALLFLSVGAVYGDTFLFINQDRDGSLGGANNWQDETPFGTASPPPGGGDTAVLGDFIDPQTGIGPIGITIVGSANLATLETADVTIAGTITAGTVHGHSTTLTGTLNAQNYDASLTVDGGTVNVSGPSVDGGVDLINGGTFHGTTGDIMGGIVDAGSSATFSGTTTLFFTVQNGGTLTAATALGGNIVTGAGSTFTASGSIGGPTVSDGGVVTSGGSLGTGSSVTGLGSRWTINGSLNLGDPMGLDDGLTVSNGGVVVATGAANLGAAGGGQGGFLTLQGEFSVLTTGALNAVNGTVNVTTGALYTTNGDATLDTPDPNLSNSLVNGAGSEWDVNGNLTIGNNSTAVLGISSGGLLQVHGDSIVLGAAAGSNGTLEVDGPFSMTDTAGQFTTSATSVTIGSHGTGTLNLLNGITADLSTANVVLGDQADGTGNLFVGGMFAVNYSTRTAVTTNNLTVGNFGTGNLTVSNFIGAGETLTTLGNAIFAAQGGSAGNTGDVGGSNAFWRVAQNLTVGQGGGAVLTVDFGGTMEVDGDMIELGMNQGANGTITLDGTGSTINTTAQINVGDGGSGTLNVQNGATLPHAGALNVGMQASGFGTVLVTGAGTSATFNSATIGQMGGATATITAGASVTITNDVTLGGNSAGMITGNQPNDAGLLTVSAQNTTLNIGGDLNIGGSDTMAGVGLVTVSTMAKMTVSGDVNIGNSGNGTLTLQSGGTFEGTGQASVAAMAGSIGTLSLTGQGTTFTSDQLTIGDAGTATATIAMGSSLVTSSDATVGDQSGSKGTMTLTDAGTTWTVGGDLTLGGTGMATVTMQNGASLSVGHDLVLGEQMGGNGKLFLTGANTLQISNDLTIGAAGSGSVTVQQAGSFTAKTVNLGEMIGGSGTLTVTGAGSMVTVTDEISVGGLGTGTVSLSMGGELIDSAGVTLADDAVGSHGTGTVATGSTWIVDGDFTAGHAGVATVTVSGGSHLDVGGDTTIAEAGGAIGSVTVTGVDGSQASTLSYAQSLTVGEAGSANLFILSGGHVAPSTGGLGGKGVVEIAADANSLGTVTITGSGSSLTANTVSVGGTDMAAGGTGKIVASTLGKALINNDLMLWGSGSVNVSGGGIVVVGSITAPLVGSPSGGYVQINTGGLVEGIGTIKGKVFNRGGIRVGDDPGTFTIDGDYEQDAGGVLTIEAEGTAPGSPTGYSQLVVTGDASLAGTVQLALLNNFKPSVGETFNFLQVTGTTTGAFANVSVTGLPTTDVQGTVTGDTVIITGLTTDFMSPSLLPQLTPNQRSVGTALNSIVRSASGDAATILASINALPSGQQVAAAYDQLMPERLQIFRSIAFDNITFATQQLDDHFANLRDGMTGLDTTGFAFSDAALGSSLSQIKGHLLAWQPTPTPGLLSDTAGPALGGIATTNAPVSENERWSTFINGNVTLANLDSNADVSHSSYTTGGVTMGADYRLDRNWTVGALFGYNHTDADLDNEGSTATIDTYSPGIYAAYADKGWYANGVFDYGYNSYTENRNIIFPGVNRTAIGTPQGSQYSGDLDGGYEFHLGQLTVGPSLGVNYVHLDINGFDEGGAGAAGLSIAKQEADSLRSRIGFDARWKTQYLTTQFTYHLSASWQHEYMDSNQGIAASLEAPGIAPFSIAGVAPDRDSALVDAGLDVLAAKNVDLFVDYQTEAGESDFFAQSVQSGVKIGF